MVYNIRHSTINSNNMIRVAPRLIRKRRSVPRVVRNVVLINNVSRRIIF